MKRVMDSLRKREVMERLPVVKMEIDYELMTLFEAMEDQDEVQVKESKERLEQLRKEWIHLQVS
ncbi:MULTISPECIES: hypothetical protein [Pontibacillus]|uniref:Fur-regulated basic protein B n=1 Tax=Pontibacillus chungwhensis TaxID=265426 RepID=A0ABY8V5F4_9BACI|nr:MULTISPECIES: hypothetical protein [Pontibacillus]MCD5322534.1 hypothetical protein [Pontibacillus sp. HN14]WIF99819.1 hypothetical protein QNI29_09215 [Pontibacillus chungwhensis]